VVSPFVSNYSLKIERSNTRLFPRIVRFAGLKVSPDGIVFFDTFLHVLLNQWQFACYLRINQANSGQSRGLLTPATKA